MARLLTVDASVAVKWLVEEPGTLDVLALFDDETRFIAPEVIFAEVSNALWRNVRQKYMSAEQAVEACLRLPSYLSATLDTRLLLPRALEIAIQLEHPTYDCFYIACAERHDAPVVTDDRRLLAAVSHHPGLALHVIPLHA